MVHCVDAPQMRTVLIYNDQWCGSGRVWWWSGGAFFAYNIGILNREAHAMPLLLKILLIASGAMVTTLLIQVIILACFLNPFLI